MKKYALLLLASAAVLVALIGFLLGVSVVKKFAIINILFICGTTTITVSATAAYSLRILRKHGFEGVALMFKRK